MNYSWYLIRGTVCTTMLYEVCEEWCFQHQTWENDKRKCKTIPHFLQIMENSWSMPAKREAHLRVHLEALTSISARVNTNKNSNHDEWSHCPTCS